jgi:hypothetical protein
MVGAITYLALEESPTGASNAIYVPQPLNSTQLYTLVLKRYFNRLGPHLIKWWSLVRILFLPLVWTYKRKRKKKRKEKKKNYTHCPHFKGSGLHAVIKITNSMYAVIN